jgi:hypothetical protein
MTEMGALESNIELMCHNPANSRYSGQMTEVYEAVKKCDQSVYTKTDEIVSSGFMILPASANRRMYPATGTGCWNISCSWLSKNTGNSTG